MQPIPQPDGDGVRICCNDLKLLNLLVAFVIRVKASLGVTERKMAEDAGPRLALPRVPPSSPARRQRRLLLPDAIEVGVGAVVDRAVHNRRGGDDRAVELVLGERREFLVRFDHRGFALFAEEIHAALGEQR